jgi:signal transduction histidine kinase
VSSRKPAGQAERRGNDDLGVSTDALSTLLRDLAASVLEAWPDTASASRDAIRLEIESLEAWMHEYDAWREEGHETGSVHEVEPDAADDPGASTGDVVLQRRLLEALRVECLHRWSQGHGESPSHDAATCLALLSRLEWRTRATLPGDTRDLVSRLAAPDGFELLLEVAHDLRSPLTSVSFLAETLRGGFSGSVTDQQHHQLGLIYAAALAMQAVVTDVMDLARHGADVLDEPAAPFSLSEVFANVERLVAPIAEVKGLELRLSPGEADHLEGRPLALGRILLNLATNGLKFTDQGYVELTARRVGQDEVELSVRDTGRGVDAHSQDTLFEPFRKSRDRPGSYFSGSGLGLSIVRRLVDALDSELMLETAPEWGTRFYFTVRMPEVPDA